MGIGIKKYKLLADEQLKIITKKKGNEFSSEKYEFFMLDKESELNTCSFSLSPTKRILYFSGPAVSSKIKQLQKEKNITFTEALIYARDNMKEF